MEPNNLPSPEDIDHFESKIQPDYYIHQALINAQESLKSQNLKEGIVRYRFFIEHIETIAEAGDKLPSDYRERVTQLEKDVKAMQISEDSKTMKICMFKLKLLMERAFGEQKIMFPMMDKKKPKPEAGNSSQQLNTEPQKAETDLPAAEEVHDEPIQQS